MSDEQRVPIAGHHFLILIRRAKRESLLCVLFVNERQRKSILNSKQQQKNHPTTRNKPSAKNKEELRWSQTPPHTLFYKSPYPLFRETPVHSLPREGKDSQNFGPRRAPPPPPGQPDHDGGQPGPVRRPGAVQGGPGADLRSAAGRPQDTERRKVNISSLQTTFFLYLERFLDFYNFFDLLVYKIRQMCPQHFLSNQGRDVAF